MRNLLILFIVACSLFFTACDLLTSPANPNYLNDLQEELAWANAQRLTVSIVVPFGWGNSNPGEGLIRTIDIRKGEGERYGFDVEFIPNSGFGFRGWLAFTNSAYENIASSLNTLSFETLRDEHSLYREGVTIIPKETFTASFLSRITINVSEQVILVPFSDTRPQVVRSNPPLVPAISPFPYDQRIIIWFNMGIDEDTVKIGEIIRISAVDRLGQPVGVNGDISDYFTVRVYDPLDFRLEIAPKDNDDFPAFDLQLLNISVEIGRSIRSTGENSFEMPAVQTVTYLTDSTQAQKIYEANNIQVSRRYPVTTENPLFGDFGTHWGNPMIDRRFNRVGTEHPLSPQFDYNTAHIQFTVAVPDGAPSEPNRIFIYEQLFADLGGFAVTTNLMGPFSYEDITPIGGFYSISHSLRTIHSGIIRLIVIPWNESMSEHGSADTEHFIPQELTAAVAASHFVTIVMDDEAPHMNDMGAVLSGGTLEGGVYNFARNANFTLTLERLHLLSDNGIHGGIHFNEAWSRPWTMDDRRYLEWR
ncbi:MAG: hypothetical protein LBC80_00445, partial [Treponema sp.]|nr:hypothetical protein [Treponema sp.]